MSQDICLEFHEALCLALGVRFRLGAQDRYRWERFSFDVNQCLEEDQQMTPADVSAVVAMMRKQNEQGRASWALRYNKILFDAEVFRDLLLESRRRFRPQKPRTVLAEQQLGEVRRQVEVPSAEEQKDQEAIKASVAKQVDLFFAQSNRTRRKA